VASARSIYVSLSFELGPGPGLRINIQVLISFTQIGPGHDPEKTTNVLQVR
jgi:hypothetical protein